MASVLLRLYPKAFRDAHGPDLLAFWEAQAGEARYRGILGRVRLFAHLGRDAVVGGMGMRLKAGGRSDGPGGLGSPERGEGMMRGVWTDLRNALRAVLRTPMFSAMAVVTLGLGIGAATAVFSVVNGVVMQPLPYPDPERLVLVPATDKEGETADVSWLDFADWRDGAAEYLDMASFAENEGTFEWEDGAEQLTGALVTADYFEVLGVAPAYGRGFTAAEDEDGGPDAIILSDGFWRSRFGADPSILGTAVPMDGERVPVVGIMPPGFDAPYANTQFWSPMQEEELMGRVGLPKGTRSLSFASAVGRLADDTDIEQARTRLRALAARIDEEVGKRPDRYTSPTLVPMLDDLVGGVRAMLFLVLAAAGLVLLVASANVAGLALSRAVTRQRELAVRAALGAPRSRLVRQFAAESLVIAGLAGVFGLAVAVGLQHVLVRLAPPGLPRLDAIGMSVPVIGFFVLATLASAFLFGLPPAIRATRNEVGGLSGLTTRGASAGARALRPQQILVSFQVAVAVVLLTAAALLTRSFARLAAVDMGFSTAGVMIATVSPGDARYTEPTDIEAFYSQLLTEVRRIPGVASATTTYSPPLVGNGFRTSVVAEGQEEDPDDRVMAGTVIVRDDYFETNGVPLLLGRHFDERDRLGEPPVAIVSQAMAERLWPGRDPIGEGFTFSGALQGSADSFNPAYFPEVPYTVVGVAGDVRRAAPGQAPAVEYYRPHAQLPWGFQYLMIRTSGPVEDLAGQVRRTVWSIDPTIPVRTVRSLESYMAESVAEPRFRMIILAGFGGLTGLLSMVGLYAIMSLAVARRTREMGIRLALGAGASTVVRGVLGGGLRLVAVGAALGLVVAWFGSRVLATMLYDLSPTDPLTYVVVLVLTGAVALAACYAPARRAGRVDPVRSLQEE